MHERNRVHVHVGEGVQMQAHVRPRCMNVCIVHVQMQPHVHVRSRVNVGLCGLRHACVKMMAPNMRNWGSVLLDRQTGLYTSCEL